ncbi:MAG: hypothetical protein AAFN50_14385, partial [Pseudomonadota bacterium]
IIVDTSFGMQILTVSFWSNSALQAVRVRMAAYDLQRTLDGAAMNRKKTSGLVGIVVGGIWLANNFQHFDEQGFVAIGMPILILVAGVAYFISGMKSS